ncbi:MAG: hypothetical protein PVJ56_18930 [Desulfobacterales bacterium]|jgi:hypothetical protein
MDILKNKASGKYFIHIEDMEDGSALFFTPLGELKVLELSLFERHEPVDEESFFEARLDHPASGREIS